jgi:sugar fermentation stimulation protein A
MESCWEPGAPVELSYSDNPRRKLPWTLERVDMGNGWIGVNTMRTNGVIAEGVERGKIPQLLDYRLLKREVSFQGESGLSARFDMLLQQGGQPDAFVEVKNVTLLDGDRVRFPDAVTERGRKHLDLLSEAVDKGLRAVLLFAVNRPEGDCFSPAETIDSAYSRRLREVVGHGVEALAVRIEHTGDGLWVGGPVPMDLET